MIRFNIVYQKGLSYMQIYHYNVNMFCSKIKFHKNTVYIALSVLGRSVSIFFFFKTAMNIQGYRLSFHKYLPMTKEILQLHKTN